MTLPHAIEFKPDGTRMFITTNEAIGSFDLGVWQFKLTTPWDSTSLVCEKIYEIDIDDASSISISYIFSQTKDVESQGVVNLNCQTPRSNEPIASLVVINILVPSGLNSMA